MFRIALPFRRMPCAQTPDLNRCPSCGVALDGPGAEGMCPACLMSGVLRADAETELGDRFRSAGLVTVGKTNLPELGS